MLLYGLKAQMHQIGRLLPKDLYDPMGQIYRKLLYGPMDR